MLKKVLHGGFHLKLFFNMQVLIRSITGREQYLSFLKLSLNLGGLFLKKGH